MVSNTYVFPFEFLGKDFVLTTDLIQETLSRFRPVADIGNEVVILSDCVTEEVTESFILEINNATLVPTPNFLFIPSPHITKYQVLLHRNHTKLEVVIEDDDG